MAGAVWLSLLGACSKYGLPIQDSWPNPTPEPVVFVPEGIESARPRLRAYLERRRRLDVAFEGENFESRFNQPWVNDISLRYYSLVFDTRTRQRSAWKAQWSLKPISASRSELRLKVLEVVYMGPPRRPGAPGPALDNQWFEAEPDSLRALLELRRYWQENYETKPPPSILTGINLPSLEGPPLSKMLQGPRWKALTRLRAF